MYVDSYTDLEDKSDPLKLHLSTNNFVNLDFDRQQKADYFLKQGKLIFDHDLHPHETPTFKMGA